MSIEGTGKDEDRDTVIVEADAEAPFGRRMYEKHTGKEIPFGTYPNIDWS
jgi:hypothetical protein